MNPMCPISKSVDNQQIYHVHGISKQICISINRLLSLSAFLTKFHFKSLFFSTSVTETIINTMTDWFHYLRTLCTGGSKNHKHTINQQTLQSVFSFLNYISWQEVYNLPADVVGAVVLAVTASVEWPLSVPVKHTQSVSVCQKGTFTTKMRINSWRAQDFHRAVFWYSTMSKQQSIVLVDLNSVSTHPLHITPKTKIEQKLWPQLVPHCYFW